MDDSFSFYMDWTALNPPDTKVRACVGMGNRGHPRQGGGRGADLVGWGCGWG
jgi:hypothetical protein